MWHTKFSIISVVCFLLLSCTTKPRGDDELIIGTISGPETQLMEVAKKVAAEDGLKIKIITFEDYIVPNTALAEDEIDANMFQHQPYLDVVLTKQHYDIASIGKMFIYPMGLYSKKYKALQDLPNGATIGIPNDPSNGARALRLLANANLITIPDNIDDLSLNTKTILTNPRNLVIKEITAAQLPRVLDDVDAAAINTNYAIPAGLIPGRDALTLEQKDSPYANIVVVRRGEMNREKYKKLMKALHSPEVMNEADKLFNQQAIPAWQ